MTNISKLLRVAAASLFLLYEGLMFYLIHFKDADPDAILRYRCIIAAALFSISVILLRLITGDRISDALNPKNGLFILVAMLFTLAADYYLVALPTAKELEGVTVFLGTQLFLFLHILINDEDRRSRRVHIITRISLSVIIVLVAFAVLGDDTDKLAIISVIYYANLVASTIFAHRSGRGGAILTIGLLLFMLCDINVGLSNLDYTYIGGGFKEGTLLYEIVNSDIDLAWFFYIPSQTLIPMTLLFCDKKSRQR